jgi:tetratricopeptide (TPR) repeat protein
VLRSQDPILLRGITISDARAIVGAWSRYGPRGLGALADIHDLDRQATAFANATRDIETRRFEGSLFGGLLSVRFDEEGLRAHVRAFLSRLRQVDVAKDPNAKSLFDALLYIAAVHAIGIQGLNENVLADLLSVPQHWINTRVIRPLGEEAAAVHSAGQVFTRHRKIAEAILVEAEAAFDFDIGELWGALVRQVLRTNRNTRLSYENFGKILKAGPLLYRRLPKQFSKERRKDIAIAAAVADCESQPERLSAVVNLGKTYRVVGDTKESVQLFREELQYAHKKIDFAEVIRGFWYEWGVCEGEQSDDHQNALANAYLSGVSLSDIAAANDISDEQAKLSCAGLGVAFGKLARYEGGELFAKGQRAAAHLGRFTDPDPRAAKYFKKHDQDADQRRVPRPATNGDAVTWLTSAIVAAGREIKDPILQNAIKKLSFNSLANFFGE